MKKSRFIGLLSLSCFLLMPIHAAYAKSELEAVPDPPPKPHQDIVPDTVKDPHSKLTAKYAIRPGLNCTAILISSTAALTARHCVQAKRGPSAGRIYPGANGEKTPFGYMNISSYALNPKYDVAVIKGTERDQDKFYKYYIGKFKTTVTGYSDQALLGFVNKEAYSYGYPKKGNIYYQYRSDGSITRYVDSFKFFYTNLPSYGGQSGSGVTLKSGQLVGIITDSTVDKHEAHALALTTEIAQWINNNAK
ncbi:trypsin-like serine peptidase [Staphylococcus intermedius]|uniref:Putative glutamyl-endopeptidase n=1 Tax=Staphylococcus intermedius NCTC 11048 TaxID=1141106 RepID=A0A380G997_STAIN|nr:trypsin-like peptidase domain-containing protein [Staphylococcus intermedius]PCF65610.1 serine protease [Staphylococcus intermedius]PCF81289.1 serine protease [Staphylococcus intermedius]PCF82572.1 serine protease [Staphylococcus intermedius]PCF87271.1 serine protease [Staphylococcus intermedius]PNZ54059.1 serine protease [Staphylococcus intermedius NCTC 11048]